MRTILVPVADRPECAVALATAFNLAKQLEASVHGYHIRPHTGERSKAAHVIPYKLDNYSEWQKFLSDDEVHLSSTAAHEFFQRMVKEHKFTFTESARYQEGGRLAQWHEMKGSPEKVFSIIGPVSDLIVVSRPKLNSSIRARSFMVSALMHTGRPVLILPHSNPPIVGKRILLAWNQSLDSAATAIAALPLLQRAEKVQVLVAGKPYRVGPKAKHLQQYLKYWNVKAELIDTPGSNPEAELTNTYIETNSDLLVMGAYSRGQLRESVFGGMTDHVLNHTTLPTLMLHR